MNVQGAQRRTLVEGADGASVEVIDQRRLPHELVTATLRTCEEAAVAIREMWVRGAPLIGVTGAYGLALALKADGSDGALERAFHQLAGTRPTAVNLRWALEEVMGEVRPLPRADRAAAAWKKAGLLAEADVSQCRAIGAHGASLIQAVHARAGRPVNVLTHCNAGWLATIDWGTALAPIYVAHRAGVPLHVWVDETRPRNQGSALTAWELQQEGVPFTVIADNAGGHLLQRGQVDLCIVGSDRTTRIGDVCNKIGTYLKALAARANDVPFYVALPSSSIDWSVRDGVKEIPIEERDPAEVTHVSGWSSGRWATVRLTPEGAQAANPAFDVTPAAYVSKLVTERGVCDANEVGLLRLFPERA